MLQVKNKIASLESIRKVITAFLRSLSADTAQCFEYTSSSRSCINGNELIRSEDQGTISFEITPSYRNLNIRYVHNG